MASCSGSPTRILVEWTTVSEVNTAGFNLYRSEQPDGTFVKVNGNLIPASPDPLVGGKYKYEDADVKPGLTYYYKLEDVELGGTTELHGPIKITASGGWDGGLVVVIGAGALAGLVAIGVVVRKRMKDEG